MITNKIKRKIIKNAKNSFPCECCGFIVTKNNKVFTIDCENIAKDKENDFMISAKDFLYAKNNSDEILFLYHNHIDAREFSILDKQTADSLRINLLLYINALDCFKIYYYNEFSKLNYLFEEYNRNENNCFHLIKNYFNKELNLKLNIDERLFKDKDITSIEVEDIINRYHATNNLLKLKKDTNLKINDILILKNKISTHLAVYIGNNKIIHQPLNRISIIEDLSKDYQEDIQGVLRSKKFI